MEKEGVAALIFIALCAFFDIRTGKIPLGIILIFGMVSVGFLAVGDGGQGKEALYGLLPGALILALGLCTRESIGYGDGLTALVLGLLIGPARCAAAVLSGFFLSAVCGLILLLLRKVNGKSRLPWMPFLAAGLCAVLLGAI